MLDENYIDTGVRAELKSDEIVCSGEEYTFSFDNLVIDDTGVKNIRFTMLQEGKRYFGEYLDCPIGIK